MNDFTKKELIALKNGIEYLPQSVNLDKKYQEMCGVIVNKLESMIDDYSDDEFTDEEQDILDKIKKPLYSFGDIQKELDRLSREKGYADHRDFLISTGWYYRFDKEDI